MQQQTPYPEFLRVQYQCIPLSPLHLVQEIRDSVTMDNSLHKLIEEKHMDITSHPAYSITSQGLQRKGKWVVGENSTLRTRIIKEIHDGSSGGYSGRDATRKRISSFCYWRGQTKDIDQYIKESDVCQRSKSDNSAYPGLLHPSQTHSKFGAVSPWTSSSPYLN